MYFRGCIFQIFKRKSLYSHHIPHHIPILIHPPHLSPYTHIHTLFFSSWKCVYKNQLSTLPPTFYSHRNVIKNAISPWVTVVADEDMCISTKKKKNTNTTTLKIKSNGIVFYIYTHQHLCKKTNPHFISLCFKFFFHSWRKIKNYMTNRNAYQNKRGWLCEKEIFKIFKKRLCNKKKQLSKKKNKLSSQFFLGIPSSMMIENTSKKTITNHPSQCTTFEQSEICRVLLPTMKTLL